MDSGDRVIYASVPVIEPPDQMRDTADTWKGCGPELLIVDNTPDGAWCDEAFKYGWSYIAFGRNLGVPAAWNIGRARFLADAGRDFDLLLLFSASVRWDDGLSAALDQLSYAANWKGCQTQAGPHAMAYSRRLLELAGSWDENYYPGYYSDNDFFYRGIIDGWLLAGPDAMPQIEVNCPEPEDGRALRMIGLISNMAACLDYYERKWGGPPTGETFTSPFNSGLPTFWWSPAYRPGLDQITLGESEYR